MTTTTWGSETELAEMGIRVLLRLTPDERLSLFIGAVCEAHAGDGTGESATAELRRAAADLIACTSPEGGKEFDEVLAYHQKYSPYTISPPRPRIQLQRRTKQKGRSCNRNTK